MSVLGEARTHAGGAVLSTGSIVFTHDNYRDSVSRLLRSALDRLLAP